MRPFVTLTFAQSLDGCIAARAGQPTKISGAESAAFTHQLRAEHDAVLVGVGTVISDDPRLTVRYAHGSNPRPVVLDSRLRIPLTSKLLAAPALPAVILTTSSGSQQLQLLIESVGAHVHRIAANDDGHVDLHAALDHLSSLGIRRLMVEGGAMVIAAFLQSELVDRLIVTVAPVLLGGLHALEFSPRSAKLPKLRNVVHRTLGDDIVIEAETRW